MRSDITPGQTSDYLGFELVMADNLPKPAALLVDRGYDSDNVRKTMEARNIVPVIPERHASCASRWTAGSIGCATWSSGASTS